MEKTKLMPKKQPASKCCCHTVSEDKPAENEGGLHIVAGKAIHNARQATFTTAKIK